ncbi:hypothetical protein [Lacihabitans soyangensis]|uniref:Uncharacterized protein n=1 Tax=Lacihabitans soyangensis TaxID=869394 RepID=A0AAE3KR29_9BACT|nr:hypothetical protein [Lacihabitans soyangensis]MCP9761678.1 hypothetical protein [Lacihabitans soyangensis]
MLTFFRINSIFQVITLLALLLGLKMIYIGSKLPLLTYELEWMLVGEKLNEGLKLYSEVLTQVGPLSSFVYQMIDLWAGKNQFVYETIASVLIFIQTLYFVFITNRRNLFNEKNYIPGLVYLVLINASFDFLKLSPALMANTFVLMALNSTLRQIEKREGVGDDVFEAGLFLGIATLFHLPSFVLLAWAILVLFLYTGINIRQTFMVILAFIMPIFFMYLYFYFNDQAEYFTDIWLFHLSYSFDFSLLGLRDILVTFVLPMALGFFGIIRVLRGHRYNSFQNRSHQLIIISSIFILVSFFVSGQYTPSNMIYIVAPLAFFCAGFFIHGKKMLIPETLFLLFFVTTLFISVSGAKPFLGVSQNGLANFRVIESELKPQYQGKRIFVTGQHIDAYKTNEMATGYLSWSLAKNDFEKPNNYVSLSNIYNNFKKDMPEVIIDGENVIPAIFKNIPELGAKYKASEKGIYVRI